MLKEDLLQVLEDNWRKIDGLKGFHIPVVLNLIEDYEKAEIDTYFIEQQKLQLQKLLKMLAELEGKSDRIMQRLILKEADL